MGRACAEIAVSGIKPVSVFDAAAQMTRTGEYAQELITLLPQLTDRIEVLLKRLAVIHSAAGSNTLRPIHGSPHAHQWLQHDKVLGLVDFDRFGLGDPELDVATFLGEMDFERNDFAPKVAQAFQQGYQSVYGALNPDLITAYRAHKRFAKVRRAAYKPSPKAPDKVLRHLVRAEACLDTK
jgi:thiamine kinase-like enzyme